MATEDFNTTPSPLSAKTTWGLILAALYLPQTWYLFMDYPWNDYRLYWLKLVPGLPAALPVMPLGHGLFPNIWILVAVLWLVTGVMVYGLWLLSKRGRTTFTAALAVAAVWSIASAIFAHAMFRA